MKKVLGVEEVEQSVDFDDSTRPVYLPSDVLFRSPKAQRRSQMTLLFHGAAWIVLFLGVTNGQAPQTWSRKLYFDDKPSANPSPGAVAVTKAFFL